MKPIIKLMVFILSLNANLFAQSGWLWQNPLPQGNSLRDIHVFDQNTALAVGDAGTVMETTDGGINWHVQHYAGGTTKELNSVSFIDTNTGWAVGGAGTILKTIDGGTTWSAQTSGTIKDLFSVCFITHGGTDIGWAVGGEYPSGVILKTTDGGTTWSAQTSGATNSLRFVYFMDADTGWVVGDFGTILKTTDSGTTWAAQTSGTTEDLNSVCFITQGGANTGWAVGSGGTILKTIDGGATWSAQTSGTRSDLLSVHFVDANTGWAAGGDFFEVIILKTTDGGTTWSAHISETTEYLNSVFFIDANTGWTVGTKGTILKTTNGGKTWPAQHSGTDAWLLSVYFVPHGGTNTGWAVGEGGAILKTTNGGTTWLPQASTTTELLTSVSFFNADTGWAAGFDGTILKTTNGGSTWSIQTSGTTVLLTSIFFIDADTGWAVGDVGTILKTTDGGNTWLPQTSGTIGTLGSVRFIPHGGAYIGWAVGDVGTILKTTDGGSTWSAQTSGTTETLMSVSFIDAETGWTVGANGTMLQTTDGGTTWSVQTSGTTEKLNSVSFIDAETGWAVGAEGTMLKTTNGGITWSAQASGTLNHLWSVFFITQGGTNTGWVVGDGGTILKTTNGETAVLNADVQEVAIQAEPGKTATGTFKLSNTGTVDLSFEIIASEPTSAAPLFSSVLKARLTGAANSFASQLPPLALNETTGEKLKTSQAQVVQAQTKSFASPAVVGDDVLFLDDGNERPDNFLGLQGNAPTYWLNRFVAPGNGFQLERIHVFASTDTVSHPSFFVAVDTETERLVGGFVTPQPARDGSWHEIRLETPLSFKSGQVFFIVLGAPKTIAYPAGVDQYGRVPNNSYYFSPSQNGYVPLSGIRGYENGAFLIRAVGTKTPDRLTANPASGTIAPGASQTITVTFDTPDLAEGDYQGQLSIRSNGGNRVMPVRIHVSNTTGVDDNVTGLPREFKLEQNYPNPFNPETSILYELPQQSKVTLAVYDIMGRRVALLESGMKTTGQHFVRWNGRDSAGNRVPSGIYFYRLEAASPSGMATVLTKKMTVMK